MPYDANTNWDNEEKYLNGLVSQGGGNAAWAQNQLKELNAARAQYGGAPASGGGYTQQDVEDYWKNDRTDYSARMANAQNEAEWQAWARDREQKAAAQGIDISGGGNAPSNAELWENWRRNNYNAAERTGYISNGQNQQGYYGMDGEGHWGYYDDSALTRKSANGTWDQYASSDGGYVRLDARGIPDMSQQDMSRAGQTVYLRAPGGQWRVTYNANGYPEQVVQDGLGYHQLYDGPMYTARADSDQGITSRELLYDRSGKTYGATDYDAMSPYQKWQYDRMNGNLYPHVGGQGWGNNTSAEYQRILAERGNREGIGPVEGMERLIANPGGYAENPGRGVQPPVSAQGGAVSPQGYGSGASGSFSVNGTPGGGGGASAGGGYNGGSGYDLTEYIRRQQAAALEAELAGLKSAYDTSVNGYNDQLARLQPIYDAQRNRAAAQDAVSQRGFDERAAALGLSSGAQGQAAVSRAQALQSALAGIGEAEGNARSDVELQMRNLTAQYESAIAQARAEGNATLAQNLYNELVRVQNLQRSDAQRQQEYQLEMAKLGASYGDYSGLNALGVNTSAYEAELAAQREAAAAAQAAAANAYEPTFTVSQVTQAIKNGWVTDQVLRDYEYYYGAPYGGATGGYAGSVGAANTVGGSGSRSSSTGTPSTSTKKTGSGYNNGSLTSAQVRQLQGALGVAQDGYFGPASQAAAKARYGTSDANAAWSAYQSGGNTTRSITSVGFEPDEGILSWNGKRYSSAEALANAASNAGLSRVQLQEIARQIKALTGREVGLQPVEPEQYTK